MSLMNSRNLSGITPQAMDRYLFLLGWRRDDSFCNKNIWKYISDKEPEVQLLVPARDDFPDYLLRLKNVISVLSELNEINESDILRDLRTTYSDRLEFRIISQFAEMGKLPLDYAADCIDGIKNLILYSACAVQDAKPICLKASNYAKKALSQFELGQTEIGSFIINVDAKVADENDDHVFRLTETPPPLEHKVVERISTALQQVIQATEGTLITDIATDAYKEGITANMCESLLKLKPDSGSHVELETTIHYASAVTDTIGIKKVAKFSDLHFSVLQEIANIYRDKTVVEDMTLVGFINKMQLHNQDERTISIECRLESGKRLVQVRLTEKQHELACDAYKKSLLVQISGVVDKSTKLWTVEKASNFSVLSVNGEVVEQA